MDLSIHFDPPHAGVQRVALAGRLDTHSYGALDAQLAQALAAPATHSVVLDLAQLHYISSAGVRSILKARKAMAPRHGKVLVVNPQPQIQKVLDMVKAVPLDAIFASTAEADAYLDAMQRKVLRGARDEDDGDSD